MSVSDKWIEKDRVLEQTVYGENGEVTKRIVKEFDEDENLRKESVYDEIYLKEKRTCYSADGRVTKWEEVTYMNLDKKERMEMIYPTGSEDYWTAYEYDSNGFLCKQTTFLKKGEETCLAETELDCMGNRRSSSKTYSNGDVRWGEVTEYDGEGNVMRKKHYNPDGSVTE